MNYFAAHNGTSEPTARWRNFGRPQQPTVGSWSSQGPRPQPRPGDGGIQWNPQSASQLYNAYQNTNDQSLRDAMIRDMQGNDNAQGFNSAMRQGGYMLNGGPNGQYSYTGGFQPELSRLLTQGTGTFGNTSNIYFGPNSGVRGPDMSRISQDRGGMPQPGQSKGPNGPYGQGGYQAYRDRVTQAGNNIRSQAQNAKGASQNPFAQQNATRGMGGGMSMGRPTSSFGEQRTGAGHMGLIQ